MWIFIILYPNPFLLITSLERLSNPPVNSDLPLSVNNLPSDPEEIEKFVASYVEYEYDFGVYGVPWYIPNPQEVIGKGAGDCKSRAILFASILERKGISYSFHVSPVHFWVDYPGKKETEFTKKYENATNALYSDGEWRYPQLMELQAYYNSWKATLWESMPLLRKILLIGGLVSIASWNRLIRIKNLDFRKSF
ncbi:MAG: transglutaminase domain-containing protein [Candidatus Hadarchaeota archaeon]